MSVVPDATGAPGPGASADFPEESVALRRYRVPAPLHWMVTGPVQASTDSVGGEVEKLKFLPGTAPA
ncbi:hypothetical protein [Streptomyces sp. NPDC037389]|uniref:hypothetical protein n=1 Tax=Streptomyces sp. NPDC037389 TaxID=3155369 RepID=UPI0033F6E102